MKKSSTETLTISKFNFVSILLLFANLAFWINCQCQDTNPALANICEIRNEVLPSLHVSDNELLLFSRDDIQIGFKKHQISEIVIENGNFHFQLIDSLFILYHEDVNGQNLPWVKIDLGLRNAPRVFIEDELMNLDGSVESDFIQLQEVRDREKVYQIKSRYADIPCELSILKEKDDYYIQRIFLRCDSMNFQILRGSVYSKKLDLNSSDEVRQKVEEKGSFIFFTFESNYLTSRLNFLDYRISSDRSKWVQLNFEKNRIILFISTFVRKWNYLQQVALGDHCKDVYFNSDCWMYNIWLTQKKWYNRGSKYWNWKLVDCEGL